MAKKTTQPSLQEILGNLRSEGFDVVEQPGGANHFRIAKYGVAAVLTPGQGTPVAVVEKPGAVVGGEIARLLDRGFQKFLKTSRFEVTATADHLRAIHRFTEELTEKTGATSLYNESLGTVSNRYVYDRVLGREKAPSPLASTSSVK